MAQHKKTDEALDVEEVIAAITTAINKKYQILQRRAFEDLDMQRAAISAQFAADKKREKCLCFY